MNLQLGIGWADSPFFGLLMCWAEPFTRFRNWTHYRFYQVDEDNFMQDR